MRLLTFFAVVTLAYAAPKGTTFNFHNLYKQPIKVLESKPRPRIIGGTEATPHSIPYQAHLEIHTSNGGWYCSGVLISENYVLTAGHCLFGVDQIYVTLGAHYVYEDEDTQEVYFSNEFVVHAEYDAEEIVNDVGVVLLPSAVPLSHAIDVVSLPSSSTDDYVGQLATVSGWGLTEGGATEPSEVLNFLQTTVITNRDCSTYFGILRDSILCTSGLDGSGICYGDSGGPLVTNGELIGVVSFGVPNCWEGYPSAYSRVSSFLDWLSENTDVVV